MKKVTKATEETYDAQFIAHPDRWPRWPYLPIKRHTSSGPECCLLVASEHPWSTVYDANLYAMPATQEKFKATAKYKYSSIAELQADGWIVD